MHQRLLNRVGRITLPHIERDPLRNLNEELESQLDRVGDEMRASIDNSARFMIGETLQ